MQEMWHSGGVGARSVKKKVQKITPHSLGAWEVLRNNIQLYELHVRLTIIKI